MADYKDIAGRIRTTAADGIVVESQEIIDLQNGKTQQEINSSVQTELNDRYTKEETYSQEELDSMITTPDVNYVSVVATDQTTAVTDVLPAEGEADTIYRVGNWDGTQYDATVYSLYSWNGTAYVCLAVRSFVGEVYDISANHPDGQGNPTEYADLAAALGTDGVNVPAGIRRGGMSVKFVCSSDNKYVQYRYTSSSIENADFIDMNNWKEIEGNTYTKEEDYVYILTDNENKILLSIEKNGNVRFGAGVPQQVIDYIQEKIAELSLDEYEDIVAFLNDFLGKDVTLIQYLNGTFGEYKINPDWLKVITDADDKILFGIKTDGSIEWSVGIPTPVQEALNRKLEAEVGKSLVPSQYIQEIVDDDWVNIITDGENKILEGMRKDGVKYFSNSIYTKDFRFENINDWLHVNLDTEGKILEGITKEGTKVINIPLKKLNLTEEGLRELKQDVLDGASIEGNLPILSGNSFVEIFNPYSNIGDALVLRGQMHMHTTNSDGWFSPTYQAERYRNAGFDFYVITDHDTYLANPEKLPITPNPEVSGIIWLGSSFEESISNSEQHINVYLTDHLMPGKTYKGDHVTANAVLTEYAVNGNSFCCLNHPNWNFRTPTGINQYQTNYKITQLINALNFCEVWNGGLTSETRDPEQTGTQENNWANCGRCWDILLTMGRKVFGLAVDDCHQNNDFLRGYVEVYSKSRTVYDIWDALVNGRFISYNGDGALNPIKVESVNVKDGCINVKANTQCDIYFYGQCEYTASESDPTGDTYTPNQLQVSTDVTSASYKIIGNEGYIRCAIKNGYNYVWLQPIIIKSTKKSYLL